MDRYFTVEQARALLPEVLEQAEQLIVLRADLTEARHALGAGRAGTRLADAKAIEARCSEILDRLRGRGLQVKGWAPLLLDFPMRHGDRELLLCWLEGEQSLQWYHDVEHGFAGRRRLDELPD